MKSTYLRYTPHWKPATLIYACCATTCTRWRLPRWGDLEVFFRPVETAIVSTLPQPAECFPGRREGRRVARKGC